MPGIPSSLLGGCALMLVFTWDRPSHISLHCENLGTERGEQRERVNGMVEPGLKGNSTQVAFSSLRCDGINTWLIMGRDTELGIPMLMEIVEGGEWKNGK